jgi:para-aminobenzoate synthetase component 1
MDLAPWDAFRAVATLRNVLFFDSARVLHSLGRYSYVMAAPCGWAQRSLDRREISQAPSDSPLQLLADILKLQPMRTIPGLPPFQGGLAGVFGYGLGRLFERIPCHARDEFDVPDYFLGVYDWVYAYDHTAKKGYLFSSGHPDPRGGRSERAKQRLAWARSLLRSRLRVPLWERRFREPRAQLGHQVPLAGHRHVASNFSRARFRRAVQRAIEYIHAGDCFQVNLAQRLVVPLHGHPVRLYERLRKQNPAPFAGYFDLGDFVIASSSPERFLRVNRRGDVETRPIKGTRPRGLSRAEDARLVAELRASPKDRAENIMIVDLLRNDLGRVCEYGSITVPSLCEVETYETVHHLVSRVHGKLRQGKTPLDLLQAAFPGGSVTGAPKIRAMEIIAELEPTARGAYCGSLGWIGFDGAMDSNILIRTFTIGRGWVQFPVGGGIVADSDPDREYEETLHKAEGLLRALA